MKRLLLCGLISICFSASAQNSLLKNPIVGSVVVNDIEEICIASNGSDVVLLAADRYFVYAVDIADNDTADAPGNLVTSIPQFIATKLNPVAGDNVLVMDMVVNPLSKSIYVLARSSTKRYIFKVEQNGASVSLLNLKNITFSQMTWSTLNFAVNDMVFGNNTLYLSSGNPTLDCELGWIEAPFTHNVNITKRATTLYKSNWGGNYLTKAPLETLAFGIVKNKDRLMGVTTCAPGFSIDVNTLSDTGLLSVTEDFNVNYSIPKKVVFMHHDNKNWLFDLHDIFLYRIGEKYLDGSQVAANKYNANAVQFRDILGNIHPGFADEEIKVMDNNYYDMIAKWDDYRLLLLESSSDKKLVLKQMSKELPSGLNQTLMLNENLNIYPNPAKKSITVEATGNTDGAVVNIVSINGKLLRTQSIKSNKTTIDVNNIPAGTYLLSVKLSNGQLVSEKINIE